MYILLFIFLFFFFYQLIQSKSNVILKNNF